MCIEKINWDKVKGLVPVVTQDNTSNEVLMLAYMNKEALKLTLETKKAHYFSRTRQSLWKKGETSGHIQDVKDILIDCDTDTILLKVDQHKVACHTGRKSCFFTNLETNEILTSSIVDSSSNTIEELYNIICQRKNTDPTNSYTAKLLQGKTNFMLKKILEEASEFTFAIKDNDEKDIIYEASDLLYHCLVVLASKNITPAQIKEELKRRFEFSGIQEKNSRPK